MGAAHRPAVREHRPVDGAAVAAGGRGTVCRRAFDDIDLSVIGLGVAAMELQHTEKELLAEGVPEEDVREVAEICIEGMKPYAAEIGLLGEEKYESKKNYCGSDINNDGFFCSFL